MAAASAVNSNRSVPSASNISFAERQRHHNGSPSSRSVSSLCTFPSTSSPRQPLHSNHDDSAWFSTTSTSTRSPNTADLLGKISEQLTPNTTTTGEAVASVYDMEEALSSEGYESNTNNTDDALEGEDTPKYSLSTLHEKTSQYLNLELFPVGSLDLSSFEEARELIWAWSQVGSLVSVRQSFHLLDRLVEEQTANLSLTEQNVSELLNYITLNAVVKNWYTCWREQQEQQGESVLGNTITAPTTAHGSDLMGPQEILQKMEEITDQCRSLGPQTKALATVMRAVVFSIQTVEEAQFVESILMKMIKAYKEGDNRMTPTIAEYNIVLSAMAKVKEPERAEAILTRLCDDFESGVSRLVPNAFSFGTVIFAWAYAKQDGGGPRAEAILDTMIAVGEQEEDSSLKFPRIECYNNVVKAWCDTRTKPALEEAERFLQRMHEDFRIGNDNARPTSNTYGIIIHSWSQMGCAEQSEAALRLMYNDFLHNENELAEVTSYQFNSAITAWHRSGAPNAVERAFSLFDNMQKINVIPDAATFGALMLGLSRSNDRSAGEKAEHILREQQRQYRAGNDECKPDTMNYNAVMHCWSVVGNANKTVALLRELMEEHRKGNVRITDERPFITAFAALARSRDHNAVDTAETIFQEMAQLSNEGEMDFYPSAICYNGLQGCWASAELPNSGEKCLSLLHEMKEKYARGDESMRPTEANYKIVIDAFARIRNPERAEEVWYEMLQSFLDGNPDAKPGNDSCKAVLASWLMSDAPSAIQRTLDVMERIAEVDRSEAIELKVNRNAYHLLLDICSKSDIPDVIAGAETIVRKMKEIHDEGRGAVGPDTRCYNIAINCWGKHGSAEHAEALFWEMYSEFFKNGNKEVKPDVIAISTVITAWRRSSNENATRRAQVFFERIQKLNDTGKLDVKLDSGCYAALLNCLANAGTEEAVDAAESIFSDLGQRYRATKDNAIRPTHQLYYAFIKCLANVGRLEKAEENLLEMHSLYIAGRRDLEPKKHFFNLILKGWLGSPAEEAPSRAEKMIRWMDRNLQSEERPDASNYANLLRCWARSRLPESGKRTEALLFEMAERFGSRRPLVADCYADVVCALARSGDSEKAEELLIRMSEDFTKHQKGATPPAPHLRAFIAVLAAHSKKSPSGNVGLRVLRLVQILREVDADDKTKWKFNNVLGAWDASSQGEGSPDARIASFLTQMKELDSLAQVQRRPETKDKIPLSLKY